jgi:hypothetical protein
MPILAQYTVSQAARRLKMSEPEAIRLIASLGVRPKRMPSGDMAFGAAAIDAYADEQERLAVERRRADDAARRTTPPRSLGDVVASDSSIFDPLAQSELDEPGRAGG